MTSRERVRRCLEFDHPDRVPRDLWILPIARLEHGAAALAALEARWPGDLSGCPVPNPKLAALTQGDPFAVGRFRDEWGCEFENVQAGVIGQVKQPPLADWSRLEDLRAPIEVLDVDVAAVNAACRASERFMLSSCCPRPFERAQFLRGTEALLKDIVRQPPELHELLGRIHALNCREIELWAGTAVDAITVQDDWGSQLGLLIAPAAWRRLFKPLYAEYVRIAHAAGKKAFLHSDGNILAIYEDLIEIGFDAVNSQLFCMDIAELGRRCAGRITFWGEIDRQHVLTHPDPAVARAAVQQVIEHLYRPAGGVIAQFELGGGARLENADAIFEAWAGAGPSSASLR